MSTYVDLYIYAYTHTYIYICRYRDREIDRDIKNDMAFFSLCDRTLCMLYMPSPTITCGAIPCPTPHAMPTPTPSLMSSSSNPVSVSPYLLSCTGHRIGYSDTSNNRTRGKDVRFRRRVPRATEL